MSREKRTILAEYFVGEGETLLFIGRQDFPEPVIVKLPITLSDLQKLVQTAQEMGGNAPVPSIWHQATWQDHWRNMLTPLVTPLLSWTVPGDTIWFVPHDRLHYFPLHALLAEGVPLIERNPIVYTPSASVLSYCRKRQRIKDGPAFIVADTSSESPLPHAMQQAVSLAEQSPPDSIFLHGNAATYRRVVDLFQQSSGHISRVHFGCHGFFDSEMPLLSGIQLAPVDDDEKEDVETSLMARDILSAESIFRLPASADMVVLSACDTGLSRHHAGDELIGLTRAILYAWAPSVVVSLWQVAEISTSLLIDEFYLGLQHGLNKAEALQAAQIYLMRLDIQTVIDRCQRAQTKLETLGQHTLAKRIDLDTAEMRFYARDYIGALQAYKELDVHLFSSENLKHLRTRMAQCEVMLGTSYPLHYDRRPFADMYYWAPFTLTGDWL